MFSPKFEVAKFNAFFLRYLANSEQHLKFWFSEASRVINFCDLSLTPSLSSLSTLTFLAHVELASKNARNALYRPFNSLRRGTRGYLTFPPKIRPLRESPSKPTFSAEFKRFWEKNESFASQEFAESLAKHVSFFEVMHGARTYYRS